MDPEAALEKIRALVREIQKLEDDEADDEEFAGPASELAEAFDGLDQWMSKGGFPPGEWSDPEEEDE